MMLSFRWIVDFVTLVLCLVSTLGVCNSSQEPPILEEKTEMVHTRIRLRCPVSQYDISTSGVGSAAVTWYHNGNKMNPGARSEKSFRFKDEFLIFKSLRVIDRGHYHCEDSRGVKLTEIQLTIHAPVTIVKEQLPVFRNISYQPGNAQWIITCPAAGIPLPTFEWRKNGEIIPDIKPVSSNEAYIESILTVPLSEPAQYNCTAMNSPGEIGPQFASVVYNVLGPPQQVKGDTDKRSVPVCAPYNGTACSEFLQGRMVLHNNTVDYSNEAALDNLTSDTLPVSGADDFCQRPALRLLCHQMYPDCENQTLAPFPICQESCLAVVTLFCFRELAEGYAKSLPSAEHCYTLPSKWDIPSTCTESDHHEFSPAKVRDDCYVDKGRWYNGTVNVTRSGRTCQRWEDMTPQKHDRSPLYFPELYASENHCRNPGGEERQPWCYTTDKLVRWEFCEIDPCETLDIPADDLNRSDDVDDDYHEQLIIILVPVLFCCLLIPIIGLLVRWKKTQYSSTTQDDVDIDVENLPINSAYHQMKSNRLNPKLETLEFPRNDIVFIEDIGQGAFGRVFKARIVCSNGNSHITGGKLSGSKHSLSCGKNCKHNRNPFTSKGDLRHIDIHANLKNMDVKLLGEHLLCDHEKEDIKYSEGQLIAIKMLKEDASDTVQADFEREASLMVEFDHPNIVRLLGVCTIGKPMCLLFEYMNKGDLNEFLRLCSPDQCLRRSDAGSVPSLDDVSSIDIVDQLHMARQICNGMVYLSERGYVHRDLATRNCLVSNSLTVKISDFGLARSVHSMDYYHGSDKDAIPIRWMPPEAILYNKFSSQSDVWSFGVLLWEIFSFALQPYYGMTHEQVINYLRAGHILELTENVTSVVYDIMKSCWHKKPTSRPTFVSLHKSVTVLYEEHSKQKARSAFSL